MEPGSSVREITQATILPVPSPGHLPDPEPEPALPALAGGFFTTEPSGKKVRVYTKTYECSQQPYLIKAKNWKQAKLIRPLTHTWTIYGIS